MYEKQIAAGMVWLDDQVPNWLDKIELATLDLDSCLSCVLGQLFGNYYYVADEEYHKSGLPILCEEEAGGLGFCILTVGDYRMLTIEWKEAISARLGKSNGSRSALLRMQKFVGLQITAAEEAYR